MELSAHEANDDFPAGDTNERLEQLGYVERIPSGWKITAKGKSAIANSTTDHLHFRSRDRYLSRSVNGEILVDEMKAHRPAGDGLLDDRACARLISSGLIERDGAAYRLTAMGKAALALIAKQN